MAAATKRPDKVLGLHFMQPVPVMPLLEMVRTFLTSEETYQSAKAFGESLGKTIVVTKTRRASSSICCSSRTCFEPLNR